MINHLFIHCDFSLQLWNHFIERHGLTWWCLPSSQCDLVDVREWGRFTVVVCCHQRIYHLLSDGRSRKRNNRILRDKSLSYSLISIVVVRLGKWLLVKKEFVNLKLNDAIHNWGTCLECGLAKVMKVESWSPTNSRLLEV